MHIRSGIGAKTKVLSLMHFNGVQRIAKNGASKLPRRQSRELRVKGRTSTASMPVWASKSSF